MLQRSDGAATASWAERLVCAPWLTAFHGVSAAAGRRDEGNARDKDWRPRAGAPAFALALVLGSGGAAAGARALAPVAGAAAAPALAAALAAALAVAGFAYTSRVTSARASALRGADGSLRDLAVVLAAAPLAAALMASPAPAQLLGGADPAPALALAAAFALGLHMPYATRPGALLHGSFVADAADVADVAAAASASAPALGAGASLKLAFIGAHVALHAAFCAELGAAGAAPRLAAYAAAAGFFAAVSHAARRTHFVHLHHWALGLALLPLTAMPSSVPAWWGAALFGFSLSQFVEGAARWGCAPLWHARRARGARGE